MRLKEEYRENTEIQKSKFIACLCPCRSEEEARMYIDIIRKEFSDATHVCTAYAIGENRQIRRSNDNGEPSGTAGIPMLEAILHTEVTDICACVVRYFGGIKLGASGLIRAYAGSVSSALSHARKVEDVPLQHYTVTYPYDMSGTLEGWLRKNTEIMDIAYDEAVTCQFLTDKEGIKEKIQDLSKGKILPVYIDTILREREIG
ncbi:MAG: YigZ family protein [Solobacterium sp.]|jgi:uncharacterized YigZ family protein|nr:YigZ family protein [Solobacterium sp.]